MRAATFPCLSMRTVEGIALAGSDSRNPISTASSIKVGYGTSRFRTKASALTGLSRVNIPIKATSGYMLASAESAGSSALHGEHQEAHTLTTATLPIEYV